MRGSKFIVILLTFTVLGCVGKKPQPVNLQPDTAYEAELPERSMEARAVEDFQRHCEAANQGNAAAIHRVGLCFMDGYGVDRDEVRGFEAFQHAATLDHVESQYRLGVCYAEGIGTEKNDAEALRWMVEAAGKNHPVAARWLADRGVHTQPPSVSLYERHVYHPPPGHPYMLHQDTFIGHQGQTAGGNTVGVGVMVRDTYDPRAIKARREHDRRREAAVKPAIERRQKERVEQEQKKKDEEDQKKKDEIKAKKSM